MPQFAQLSASNKVARLKRLGMEALEGYGLVEPRLTLLTHQDDTSFRVGTSDGARYLLRICRAQQDLHAVRSELAWLSALREQTELLVPEPQLTLDEQQSVLATHPAVPEPRICLLFNWPGGHAEPYQFTPLQFRRIGEYCSGLHLHAADWIRPDWFRRDIADSLPGVDPATDPFTEQAFAQITARLAQQLDAEATKLVLQALQAVRETREQLGFDPQDYGLIHAQLCREHWLFDGTRVAAINFAGCGEAHFLYDLAVILHEVQHLPYYPELRQALLTAYQQQRVLNTNSAVALDNLIVLRDLQLLLRQLMQTVDTAAPGARQASVEPYLARLRLFLA